MRSRRRAKFSHPLTWVGEGERSVSDTQMCSLSLGLHLTATGSGAVVKVWYRAPELLLGQKNYCEGIDVWSVGCLFAELFLLRPPFQAKEEPQRKPQMPQLDAVFDALGEPDEESWRGHTSLPLWRDAISAGIVGKARDRRRTLWQQLTELCESSRPCGAAVVLLEDMLRLSPERRISAQRRRALRHPHLASRDLHIALHVIFALQL